MRRGERFARFTPITGMAGTEKKLPMVSPKLLAVLLGFSLLLAAGCAGLPEYARPKLIEAEGEPVAVSLVAYRPLTRADFQAPASHQTMTAGHGHVNAHIATRIRLTGESRLTITAGEMNGARLFFGRIEQLAFEAVMLPAYSWWNPKLPASRTEYVLEHEQIHFALTEIAARQLTEQSRPWAAHLLVIRNSPDEVRGELSRLINDRIKAAEEANILHHERFDEDTSLEYNPRRQQWWWEKLGMPLPAAEGG